MKRLPFPALLLLSPAIAFGATITVTTTVDVLANTGTCSLREAIISANTNAPSGGAAGECPSGSSGSADTIILPAGTFNLTLVGSETGTATNALLGDLDITQSVSVQGQGQLATVINASNLGARAIHIDNSTAVVSISGVRIRDGFAANGDGGGIFLESGSSLALIAVALSSNHADDEGGGLAASANATISIQNSSISNNTAVGSGGGVFSSSSGTLAITNSAITANQTTGTYFSDGGGIYASGGTLVLSGCTISDNDSSESGGGMFLLSIELIASDSTIARNSAAVDGGGIQVEYFAGGEVKNCTFSGNATAGYGGAIGNTSSADMTLTHCTLAANSAGVNGTAIDSSGGMILKNTLVVGTCSTTPVTSLGGNLESPGDNCGLTQPTDQVAVGAGQLVLGVLASNGGATQTHKPGPSSLAVDHARSVYCLSLDQRGVARPQGPACDVGSVEVQPPLFADGFEGGNTSSWS